MPCAVPPDAVTLLYGLRKLLLVMHTATAIVLIGAATHHVLQMPGMLRGHVRPRLERLWARVTAIAYCCTYTVGAVLYPTYRYHVRALFLDRHHPMVANLFDIKENLATMALGMAIAVGSLAGHLTTDAEDRSLVRVYAGMSIFVAAVVWFDLVSGLVIVSYRSV